jgi:hypothetical protein
MKNFKDSKTLQIILGVAALLVFAAVAFVVGQHSPATVSHKLNDGVQVSKTLVTPTAAPTAMTQPPTAAQVASALDCTGYKDVFQAGGLPTVLDEGTCYKGGVKYAIDTFGNSTNRDGWLKMAEPMGVVPAWLTPNSVTYKSIATYDTSS